LGNGYKRDEVEEAGVSGGKRRKILARSVKSTSKSNGKGEDENKMHIRMHAAYSESETPEALQQNLGSLPSGCADAYDKHWNSQSRKGAEVREQPLPFLRHTNAPDPLPLSARRR
jgi:hypothetical protein